MREQSPAQQIQRLAAEANRLNRERKALDAQSSAKQQAIEGVNDRIAAIVRKELGFTENDVVVDELGNLFRVTKVSLGLNSYRYPPSKGVTLARLLEATRFEGLSLTSGGLPRWTKPRVIHARVKKYSPGAESFQTLLGAGSEQ